ncbi:CpaF family protein, partial [Mesorhizobium sp. M2A.F.Ca.ET.046.02.1.1]
MLGRFIKGPNEHNTSLAPIIAAAPNGAATAPAAEAEPQGADFLTLKVELHRHLIDRFNLTALENASKDEILNEIR